FESWITWKTGKDEGRYDEFDLREEFEYGLTDDLTTALYLNFENVHFDHEGTVPDEQEFRFDGVSSEWKWLLSDPSTDFLGTLAYGEVRFSGDEVELEGKAVLGKNFGDFVTALNLIVAHEWQFSADGTDREWELEPTIGAAYLL